MTNHVYCGAGGRADNTEAKVVVGVIGVVPVLVVHLAVVGVVVPAAATVVAVLAVVGVGIPAENFSRGLLLRFIRIYPADFYFQRNLLLRCQPQKLFPPVQQKAWLTLRFPETPLQTAYISARSLLLSL